VGENPFFEASELPYQLPPFARIGVGDFLPAFERGMAEQRAEVAAITGSAEPPTLENTLVALERSGQLLRRVSVVLQALTGADTNPELQRIEAEVEPKLAAHFDAIRLDPKLYGRISALYERRGELDLDAESRWLLERYHTEFVRAGARLSTSDQERLRTLNAELAGLYATFRAKLLAESNDVAVLVDDERELAGLPADAITAAAEAARARGIEGRYLLTLVLPTQQLALASLHNRGLRERLFNASISRGGRGNENDTGDTVRRIVRLRAERARLLGYPDHATYAIEDNTARSVDAVRDMLGRLIPAAVSNAAAEAEQLAAAAARDGVQLPLRPWDWAYYAERVRRERYAVDESMLRQYFELDRVLRDGVFYAANRLYGLRFTERPDLAGYHEDVRVFEVSEEDGTPRGLFLADMYTRDSKRGGAWAQALVSASRLLGTQPVIVNNLNISKPAPGQPTLLLLDQVRTLFHEFGHALHGLFSDVTYPRFAGTSVARDFVEFPSQVNEMWQEWPEVLANYAVHYETGEPLPAEVADRLRATAQFNEGFKTTEYLAAAALDLAWHTLGPDEPVGDVAAFEAAALERAGIAMELVPPRYRTTYFNHVFSSAAYSAGYYSYIWSEVLDADTVEWFTEHGGLDRSAGDHFRTTLLAVGGSADSMEVYRSFRGADPRIEPLLRRRGLAPA
jgi:peptidyl-dipeptidase Dcp